MTSIRSKILAAYVTLSFIVLIAVSSLQYHRYTTEIRTSIDNLLLEQVSLIINKLDHYQISDQTNFVTRTIFQLKKVKSVAVFDKNCKLLLAKPINSINTFSCKSPPTNILNFANSNIFSNSNGAVKFIQIEKLAEPSIITLRNIMFFSAIPLSIILIFAFILFYVLKRSVLDPIEKLGNKVSHSLNLNKDDVERLNLPMDFSPILTGIFSREKLVEKTQKKLVKQAELESYKKIGKQVTHDIQSPIGALSVAAQHISSNPIKSKELIERALNRIKAIVQDLGETNIKLKHNTHAPFDVLKILLQICDEKEFEFKYLRIERNLPSDSKPFSTHGSIDSFARVISNIFNNSIEAMAKTIRVSVNLDEKNEKIRIHIEDDGKGIDEPDKGFIFHEGFTTKSKGSGLGLSHAKNVIEEMNGNLKIESKQSVGVSIYIAIPISEKTDP